MCVDRHARLSFWKNPVPVSLRWMLAGEVVVNVRARFHKSLHDEQHPYSYAFEFPFLGNRLDVTREQWLVPIDEQRCMIHARVNFTARLPAISQQVEKELEKRTRIGYGLMNRLTMEYVKKKGARPQGADGGAKVAEIKLQGAEVGAERPPQVVQGTPCACAYASSDTTTAAAALQQGARAAAKSGSTGRARRR